MTNTPHTSLRVQPAAAGAGCTPGLMSWMRTASLHTSTKKPTSISSARDPKSTATPALPSVSAAADATAPVFTCTSTFADGGAFLTMTVCAAAVEAQIVIANAPTVVDTRNCRMLFISPLSCLKSHCPRDRQPNRPSDDGADDSAGGRGHSKSDGGHQIGRPQAVARDGTGRRAGILPRDRTR